MTGNDGGRTQQLTRWSAVIAAAVAVCLSLSAPQAGAAAGPAAFAPSGQATASAAETPAQIVEVQRARAANQGVQQSVAVMDRATGELVASVGGDEAYNTESILKLFTAAYYLVRADGQPDDDLAEALRSLIQVSDNGVQISLWDYDIIPSVVGRYGLSSTRNGRNASSRTWGSDRTTADDQVRFLAAAAQDPMVGPFLLDAMAGTEPEGTDGFDQDFGLNALTGVHGSKQGWSDPGWTPANLHSVGYTARYFVAILQTSPEASYATMRATATETALALAALDPPLVSGGSAGAPTWWAVVLGPIARWADSYLAEQAEDSP